VSEPTETEPHAAASWARTHNMPGPSMMHPRRLDASWPYLRASQARTLIEEIDADLRAIRVPPDAFVAFGADYWNAFVGIVRATIHRATVPAMA
jgi:hypothetical protein